MDANNCGPGTRRLPDAARSRAAPRARRVTGVLFPLLLATHGVATLASAPPVAASEAAVDQRTAAAAATTVPLTTETERCPPEQRKGPNRRLSEEPRFEPTACDPTRLPAPSAAPTPGTIPLPDRWRIAAALAGPANRLDPYHGNNPLKGDRPVSGDDGFFNLTAVSDTLLEPRRFPVPVGGPATRAPGQLDAFGDGEQSIAVQTLLAEFVFYRGNTVFQPPDYEFRFTPVFAFARVDTAERGLVNANPALGESRTETLLGIQALFIDKHLRNVSDHYDFDSLRVGVQPLTSDFRGFLLNDSPLGIRMFGTRASNRLQYNVGWFRRFDKNATTGLNDLAQRGLAALRHEDLLLANVYLQDWPRLGFTSQAIVLHDVNREGSRVQFDDNGVIQRPASLGEARGRNHRVTYLGLNGDGHFGRYNLTTSAYAVLGKQTHGTFTRSAQDVRAAFAAAELSRDFSWLRLRGSLLLASADDDPFDGDAQGYDAIFENPLFAGADTSFWIRQPVPLIGGGRVALSGRNGVLNSLRSSKEYGQSNFANPGTALLGLGADVDVTPQLRLSVNLNELAFVDTTVLEVARAQAGIPRRIGLDASIAATWRPFATQNVVVRASFATLLPGAGYRALYGEERAYSALANLIMQY
jgi:hypothetical protein